MNKEKPTPPTQLIAMALVAFSENPYNYLAENPKAGTLIAELAMELYNSYLDLKDSLEILPNQELPPYRGLPATSAGGGYRVGTISNLFESLPTVDSAARWNSIARAITENITDMFKSDTMVLLEGEINSEEGIPDEDSEYRAWLLEHISMEMDHYLNDNSEFKEVSLAIMSMVLETGKELDEDDRQITTGLAWGISDFLGKDLKFDEAHTELTIKVRDYAKECCLNRKMSIDYTSDWFAEVIQN